MEYTKLGRSGLKVSRLCLGTMNFGVDTEEKEAHKIMDAALEAGINFLDTANGYGAEKSGLTEEIIGRWFRQGGGRRERTVLATKVYGHMNDPLDGPNKEAGLSSFKIRRHLEGSLRRLGTDHVDLYIMHHVDRSVGWDELWGAFEAARLQGKIGYVGTSNFAGWDLAVAQGEAKARGQMGIVAEQHKYNLLCRLPELEVLPAAQGLGIGITVWAPLDAGLLGGNALRPDVGRRSVQQRERIEKHREQLERFSKACAELGESEDTVALAWLLHQPAVTAPILGARTLEQFEKSLKAVSLKLDADSLAKLDEIFPGPGGEAPRAYAW